MRRATDKELQRARAVMALGGITEFRFTFMPPGKHGPGYVMRVLMRRSEEDSWVVTHGVTYGAGVPIGMPYPAAARALAEHGFMVERQVHVPLESAVHLYAHALRQERRKAKRTAQKLAFVEELAKHYPHLRRT